jgi:biotin carboxylase
MHTAERPTVELKLSPRLRPGTRILVTYAWCRTAYVVCEVLARAGFEVYCCGSSALSMSRASRHVRAFFRVPDPFTDPKGYMRALRGVLERTGIQIVLPVHEDALVIQKNRDMLTEEVVVICPPEYHLATALDKLKMTRLAEEQAVDVPRTCAPTSLVDAKAFLARAAYPLLIKTRRGNSGKGVFRAEGAHSAWGTYQRVVRQLCLPPEQLPLVQELISGDLIGVCVFAINGEVQVSLCERYIRCKEAGFGTSVFRGPYANAAAAEQHARALCRGLNWTGVAQFDFIIRGEYAYFIDMNPRFWGALHLAIVNGYNFPLALVQYHLTGTFDPEVFRPLGDARPSLWIAGQAMASLEQLRSGKWRELASGMAKCIGELGHCAYDDFRWDDPLPLLVEFLYYGYTFFRCGLKVNPTMWSMLRFYD